ncbi:MAG: hypothetical protein AAGC55_21700, partial [Myxococcota bacterium]
MREYSLLCAAISSFTGLVCTRAITLSAALIVTLAVSAGCGVGTLELEPGLGSDPGLGDPSGDAPLFEGCVGQSLAHDTFNAFWYTLDARYAVFDVRLPGRSWAAVGANGCDRLGAGMSDSELYDVLIDMARQLDDGHTEIVADELARDDDGWVSVYPFYEQLYQLEGNAEDTYIDGDLRYAA